jgi:hypothetical protein
MGAISSNESDEPTAGNVSPKAAAKDFQDVDHEVCAESDEIARSSRMDRAFPIFQNKMESEGRDDSWAQFMEAQIAAYPASANGPSQIGFDSGFGECARGQEMGAIDYPPTAILRHSQCARLISATLAISAATREVLSMGVSGAQWLRFVIRNLLITRCFIW